jgi:hypothetical protein
MTQQAVIGVLLDRYGRTYAEEAGIRLRDQPSLSRHAADELITAA